MRSTRSGRSATKLTIRYSGAESSMNGIAVGARLRDIVAERQVERAAEVVDRVGAELLEPADLLVRLGIELVQAEEPIDLAVVLEREPVPVDDRITTQQQPL